MSNPASHLVVNLVGTLAIFGGFVVLIRLWFGMRYLRRTKGEIQ